MFELALSLKSYEQVYIIMVVILCVKCLYNGTSFSCIEIQEKEKIEISLGMEIKENCRKRKFREKQKSSQKRFIYEVALARRKQNTLKARV